MSAPSVGPQVGAALFWSIPAALVLAVPTLLHGAAAEASVGAVYAAVAVCAALQLAPPAALLRTSHWNARVTAGVVAVCLAAGPMAVLGQLLYSRTHHRPLGAATFVIAALIAVSLCWAVVVRGPRGAGIHESYFRLALRAAALLSVGLLLTLAVRGGLAARVLDLILLGLALLAAMKLPPPPRPQLLGAAGLGAVAATIPVLLIAQPGLLHSALLVSPVTAGLVPLLLGF